MTMHGFKSRTRCQYLSGTQGGRRLLLSLPGTELSGSHPGKLSERGGKMLARRKLQQMGDFGNRLLSGEQKVFRTRYPGLKDKFPRGDAHLLPEAAFEPWN